MLSWKGRSISLLCSYAAPQEALIIYSTVTGMIEEIVVNEKGKADLYAKAKRELWEKQIPIADYKENAIFPGISKPAQGRTRRRLRASAGAFSRTLGRVPHGVEGSLCWRSHDDL